jgi:flagellar biosynthesis protein FlhF
MHLKRYQRETVQEALRAVREDLGPDALVLSTRMVGAAGLRGWFGRRLVEVTAAAERPGVSERRHLEAPSAAEPRPVSREQQAVHEITARLEASGLDAMLAREIAQAHPREFRRGVSSHTLRQTLADHLAPLAAQDTGYAAVEVFVGPPGVGKTTTIAKIASKERALNGKRLGLVAADGFRVGAVEQLRLYADILGAPLTVARTPLELEDVLHSGTRARRPLLIDTAGRSASDEISRDMLRVLASRSDVRTHLVVSADTPVATMRRVLERFDLARPSRLVLTKVDEVESLGPVVQLLRECELPVSYLGTGQNVPEDLQPATPRALAAWVAGDGGRRGVAQ